jgi:small subunit ribosomal protein S8
MALGKSVKSQPSKSSPKTGGKRLSSSFNDPIAEMLTKIRNAKDAQHRMVNISASKIKEQILNILKAEGFIEDFEVLADSSKIKKFKVLLRYTKNMESMIRGLRRISTPGLRRYITSQEIPNVFNDQGIAILSTSQGILVGSEARKRNVGGEFLCTIW